MPHPQPPDPNRFWSDPLPQVLTACQSSAQGLSHDEAFRRQQRSGANRLQAGAPSGGRRRSLNGACGASAPCCWR
ncbi:MAG: cation-transporting P-type ATPase [Cyanobium sp.]